MALLKLKNLKESNAFLNTLLDNVDSLIFVIDKDLRVVQINEAFRMFIYKQDEEIDQDFFGKVLSCGYTVNESVNCGSTNHCHLCEFRNGVLKSLEEEEVVKKRLARAIYLKDKEAQRHFQFTTRPVDFQGEKMVLMIIDDITEMEEKKEKLKQLNEIKNRFLGTVSHDLKNPIGAIQSLAYVLLEEDLGEEHKTYVDEIYKASEYMMRLVEDLLDIYKIETENGRMNLRRVEYVQILQEVIDSHRITAKDRRIQMILEVAEDAGTLMIDRNKILQALNNLIDNALKFSPQGSKVVIRGYRRSNHFITEVQDEGPGIKKEDREKVFQEFYQGSLPFETNRVKSTGLGLAIAKKIVEAHNGEIGMESNQKGTKFFFAIPIAH